MADANGRLGVHGVHVLVKAHAHPEKLNRKAKSADLVGPEHVFAHAPTPAAGVPGKPGAPARVKAYAPREQSIVIHVVTAERKHAPAQMLVFGVHGEHVAARAYAHQEPTRPRPAATAVFKPPRAQTAVIGAFGKHVQTKVNVRRAGRKQRARFVEIVGVRHGFGRAVTHVDGETGLIGVFA